MKISEHTIDLDKLISLFFVFAISTLALFIKTSVSFPEFVWKSGLMTGLTIIGLLGYEFVIASLSVYYIAKAKKKVSEFIEKNPEIVRNTVLLFFGVSYLIISTLIEKSWLKFFRDLFMVLLIIFGLPFVYNKFKREKKNESDK